MSAIPPPLVEAPAIKPEPLRMTYQEFSAWADEDVHAEWVNGEVIVFMPPKDEHQAILNFLNILLYHFCRIFDLGRVIIAPFEMRTMPDGSAREPDILFVSRDHLDRLTPERLNGPADLIVEIVSDDSVHRDRVDKFDEYEAAGVPEYWVIDNRPKRHRAEFYQRGETGLFQSALIGGDGIYRSRVLPGFWLRVEWLWEQSPDPLKALVVILGPEKFAEVMRQIVESVKA